MKFYCHNCHGYGNYVVDCKKPKFDNDNANSRIFRNTNHVGNKRRSHNKESGERRQIIWYRCNNLGHIARTVEHLMINVMENLEEMYLYVSYVITLDTQQDFVEWIEGTWTGIRIIEETAGEIMIVWRKKWRSRHKISRKHF